MSEPLPTLTLAGPADAAASAAVPGLVADRVASRITAQDPGLWGDAARAEAAVRLSWVTSPEASRALVPEILALRDALRAEGVDRVVLAGMGGSSLAPELIAAAHDVLLVVLDGTDPGQVLAALGREPERTVLVVSSKSGSTLETDSQRRAFCARARAAGVDPAGHVVVVTDEGSPLDALAAGEGYRAIFHADPHVGGRYSALTAFGLVPAGLAGADIAALLDEARAAAPTLAADDPENPALRLGAALGATDPARDKIALVATDPAVARVPDWVEQLVAESTGKDGRGLLPVVAGPDDADVTHPSPDTLVVAVGPARDAAAGAAVPDVRISGPLGGQLLLWEYAVAVAGRLLRIDPFDQPDVEAAKAAARRLLESRPEPEPPAFSDGDLDVYGAAGVLGGATTADEALTALLARVDPEHGYLAVQAYVDRTAHASLAEVRAPLARRLGRPVTFGWGPRFLHSTGQYHKGGPATGVFLQITAEPTRDLPVPDRPFTFGQLVVAQALGDGQVLAAAGRPVLRVHVRNPATGLRALHELLSVVPGPETRERSNV